MCKCASMICSIERVCRVRKQYVFVLSRGVSMLTATSAELVIRCIPVPSIDYTFFFLFFIIDDVGFYTLLGMFEARTLQ